MLKLRGLRGRRVIGKFEPPHRHAHQDDPQLTMWHIFRQPETFPRLVSETHDLRWKVHHIRHCTQPSTRYRLPVSFPPRQKCVDKLAILDEIQDIMIDSTVNTLQRPRRRGLLKGRWTVGARTARGCTPGRCEVRRKPEAAVLTAHRSPDGTASPGVTHVCARRERKLHAS
jgi:hypothetical protein